MIRLLEARGVPVVCLKDDKRVGYLGQPIYNEDDEIRGFLVDGAKGVGRRYVELEDILRIEKENCVVYSETAVKKLGRIKPMLKNKSPLENIIGRDVVSGGKNMGIVRDLAFDMETGIIEGIELSRGFMEDIRTGRRLVSIREGIRMGEQITIKEE